MNYLSENGLTTLVEQMKDKFMHLDLLERYILNFAYPIGTVYTSTNNVSPAEFLGGTWERFGDGRVLVGVDSDDTDFATVEKEGGEKTHTLTTSEIPAHTHSLKGSEGAGNSSNRDVAKVAVGTTASTTAISMTQAVSSSGGLGRAHNNLQPYITVYRWVRTK